MGKIIRDICDIYEKIRVIRAHHPCHPWFQKSPISSGLFAHPFKMDKMDKKMDKIIMINNLFFLIFAYLNYEY